MASETNFNWKPKPETWNWWQEFVAGCTESCDFIGNLEERMHAETGTRLIDWVDHAGVHETNRDDLLRLGYETCEEEHLLRHSKGLFPPVRLQQDEANAALAIKVESIDAFHSKHKLPSPQIVGEAGARFRMATYEYRLQNFCTVERHGFRGFRPNDDDLAGRNIASAAARLHSRTRELRNPDDHRNFDLASEMIRELIAELGRDAACDLFFAKEREYWQTMNRAAQIQYARQETLGLGWANHDHHTYRSSRECFAPLIAFFEELGFLCRERFYAGEQAGWGAQVLEHPVCGIVIFADVDMTAEELSGDFAHDGLEARSELGTVGLWCKLHGESFFKAGMHHLECQFDFNAAREQLAALGIETMAPFTDFPYLKQAFTRGEYREVQPHRIEKLLAVGSITQEQANTFAAEGALHSHLEILQRNDGYKGFNQTGVSDIIHKTDPRKQQHSRPDNETHTN